MDINKVINEKFSDIVNYIMGQLKILEQYDELIHIQDKDNNIQITAMYIGSRKSIDFVFDGHRGVCKKIIVVDELPSQKDTYVEVRDDIDNILDYDAIEGGINEKRRLLLAWDKIKSLIQDDIVRTLQQREKENLKRLERTNRENEIILNLKI